MSRTLQSLMSRAKPVPKEWPGFMDSLRAAHKGSMESHKALESMGSIPIRKSNNQVSSSGIYGGYTVPPDFNLAIATSYEEEVFLYPRATVIPMLSRTTQLPRVNAETAQSVGTPPWWGGMTFSWGIPASGTITQTNPTLAQNELTARNLIGTVIASQDLAQDIGIGGDEFLFNMFARGSAWNEEYAFFNGLGGPLNQPLGIFKSGALVAQARSVSSQINALDLENMAGHMTPRGWMKAIWVCGPSAVPQVTSLTGFIPNQSGMETLGMSAIGTYFGRPMFVSDKVPLLGASNDLSLIDPSQYIIGDRAELIVQVADEPRFTTNEVVYRIWRRVDGQPLFSNYITAADGSTHISPFVGLAA